MSADDDSLNSAKHFTDDAATKRCGENDTRNIGVFTAGITRVSMLDSRVKMWFDWCARVCVCVAECVVVISGPRNCTTACKRSVSEW